MVEQLKNNIAGQVNTIDQRSEIAERWQICLTEKLKREQDDRGKGVNSAAVFAAMTRQVPHNAVISVDVGNNTYSFGRYFECEAQSVLMSGYLGSILALNYRNQGLHTFVQVNLGFRKQYPMP